MPAATPPSPQTADLARKSAAGQTIRSLSLGLIVSASLSFVTTSTLANPAADEPVSAEVAASLQAQMDLLQQRFEVELTARTDATMNALLQGEVDRQLAGMLERYDPSAELVREIDARTEQTLAALTREIAASSLAKARGSSAAAAGPIDPPLSTRMDSGMVALERDTLENAGDRRVELRHRFDRPFAKAPQVTMGVRVLHLPDADRPQVAVRVLAVDPNGFDFEVRTWGDAAASDLAADWVAYANPKANPARDLTRAAPASRY